ncbi:MAG: hypothetical protein ACO3NW_10410 [Kiritimatiellia bacterium]
MATVLCTASSIQEPGSSLAEAVKVRARVIRARRIQGERFRGNDRIHCNADMGTRELNEHCRLDAEGHQILRMAMDDLGLSARAYDRILKVSRTLADLGESESIQVHHLAEAIQ